MQNALDRQELICNPANLGFAGGNNIGISRALDMKSEFVLLLNSDAAVSEAAVSRLLDRLARNPELAIVGPTVEETSKTGVTRFAGGRDVSRHLNTRMPYEPSDADRPGGLRDADYVPGMVALIRADAFGEIGLLDEDYFFSGELADFCERARERGRRVAVDLSVAASHDSAHSGGGLRDSLYVYYGLRNRFLFVQKHRQAQSLRLTLKWSAVCLLVALRSLLRGNTARARAAFLAMQDGLARRFGNRNSLFGL